MKRINKTPPLDNGWISVTEQLPEYDIAVLVCRAGDSDTVEICRLESKTERKESISQEWIKGKTGEDSWYYDVTHWMALPKAPLN